MKSSFHSSGHLTHAEHWFRILAETSSAAVFIFRDTILYANRAAVELTGYGESELLKMQFSALLDSAANTEEAPADGPVKMIRKDGSCRWVRCDFAHVETDWQPATLLTAVDVSPQIQAEEELKRARERFLLAQRAARWFTWEWMPDTDHLETSSFADSLFGMNVQEDVRTGDDYLALVHAEDRDRLRRAIERLLKSDDALALDVRCLTPRGEVRWLSTSGVAIRKDDGRVECVLGVAQDVTEQRVTENALFEEKDRAFVTLSAIADGVIRTDSRGAIDYLNPVAQRLTGWSLAESYGRDASEIYEVVDEETGKRALDPVQHCLSEQREVIFLGQRLLNRRDGHRFPIHDSAAPIRDRNGRLTGTILVFRDLSQMRRVEQEMQHLASHDPLTGLVNRREFELLVRDTLAVRQGDRPRHALCHLELDSFKLINDTCGHTAGDQLIRQIAGVLKQGTRNQDLLARLEGNEFAILFRDCSATRAQHLVEQICDAIHRFRFHWDGRTFSTRVSVGLVPLTSDTTDPETLLGAADAACIVAKESGGGRIHVFEPGDTSIAERYGEMQWISRIQQGLDENRFCLWRQSIHPVRQDMPEPPLAELFIRLIDSEGRVIAPGEFIPAAERYGLIDSIDRWVVTSALKAMSNGAQPLRAPDARFAINISGQSLGADGFLDHITREIDATGIAPNRVLFEITETAAIANLPKAMRFISVLKEMGCLFILDDFGQGLSSFSYLKSLPLDFIKIDGAFVREMVEDPIQAALVSSIRDIGEVMGLKTIAESVEDFHLDHPQPLTTSSPPPVSSPTA